MSTSISLTIATAATAATITIFADDINFLYLNSKMNNLLDAQRMLKFNAGCYAESLEALYNRSAIKNGSSKDQIFCSSRNTSLERLKSAYGLNPYVSASDYIDTDFTFKQYTLSNSEGDKKVLAVQKIVDQETFNNFYSVCTGGSENDENKTVTIGEAAKRYLNCFTDESTLTVAKF